MIRKIRFELAVNIMLILLSAIIVFHALVLTDVIPYNIVWGGRLNSVSEMQSFETISIAINLLVMSFIAMKGRYIKPVVPTRVLNAALWLLVALFTLNTIGNIFAQTSFETIAFTPLTLVSAILCYRLVIENRNQVRRGT